MPIFQSKITKISYIFMTCIHLTFETTSLAGPNRGTSEHLMNEFL